jgi:hypothetical protein
MRIKVTWFILITKLIILVAYYKLLKIKLENIWYLNSHFSTQILFLSENRTIWML